jgi:hypothetical protein
MKYSVTAAIFLAACLARGQTPEREFTIEALGTESAAPDVFHIMMKMESGGGRVLDATASGEKQLREFLAAVEALGIPGLGYRLHNNLLTTDGRTGSLAYSRNIVFTVPDPPSQDERNRIIARVQDLGAKYNSHCVTCIGTG